MTALRFQTGGRHQTSPASLRGIDDDNDDDDDDDDIIPLERLLNVLLRICAGHHVWLWVGLEVCLESRSLPFSAATSHQ